MVESGPGVVRHPEQRFDLDPNQDWEASVNRIVKRVLIPCGYEVERLSRVPYLCQGDVGSPFFHLDDAVFVLKSKEDQPKDG
mmetsp:Transcript_33651/g.52355  ORF Transcript_33651/g.52355 Transcript_33651/m.52355 type:complete len:82 (+) Transcript_33651:476-721(+)